MIPAVGATPSTMRAVLLTGHGGLERLEVVESYPVPVPGPEDVLVAVGACALNNTDINTRIGWYAQGDDNGAWDTPLRFPRIQGADVSGEVVAAGGTAGAHLVGSRVMVDPWLRDPRDPGRLEGCGYVGSEIDGGYAEFVCVPAVNAHPVVCGLTDAELASFATSAGTALNMLRRASVSAADTVLVTGASGGVGTALVQVARMMGARVVAVSTPVRAEALHALGADIVLDRNRPLGPQVAAEHAEVDVIADVVGGAGWWSMVESVRRGGRVVVSGAVAGAQVSIDLRTLYLRDLSLLGSTVMPPGLFADLVSCVETGQLRPTVAAVLPFDRVRDAQERFLSRGHVGKIVLSGWG